MRYKIISFVLMITFLGEVFISFYKKDEERIKTVPVVNNNIETISISNVIEDLRNKEIHLMNITRENESYLIKVKITGDKMEFIKKLSLLDEYTIKDYVLNSNDNRIESIINLKYKSKVEN